MRSYEIVTVLGNFRSETLKDTAVLQISFVILDEIDKEMAKIVGLEI